MSISIERIARWSEGEEFFATALARTDDLSAPSLLLPWRRREVIAHVARNADALVNLLDWARTGVETPMYPSPDDRQRRLEETARLPDTELLADARAATARLRDAIGSMPPHAWSVEVRTAQGRTVPATDVPWMRSREVWVHGVDLDGPLGFESIPSPVAHHLLDDVVAAWGRRNVAPPVRLESDGWSWGTGGAPIRAPLPEMLAYVTGRKRQTGLDVNLPPWI